ncbi:transmembrane protein, putative [Medicago truncatula]|uniref:Transmembrane protein, putative n=1 Tax=Medicago truncatula TaxID=3880 RepID=G7IXD5_MEDTR|nr:transmembrane protein, putative [Medicago truncatula]
MYIHVKENFLHCLYLLHVAILIFIVLGYYSSTIESFSKICLETPRQNGAVKRKNRTLKEMIRTMINE